MHQLVLILTLSKVFDDCHSSIRKLNGLILIQCNNISIKYIWWVNFKTKWRQIYNMKSSNNHHMLSALLPLNRPFYRWTLVSWSLWVCSSPYVSEENLWISEKVILQNSCPSRQPTIIVKWLQETQSSNPNQWPGFILFPSTNEPL